MDVNLFSNKPKFCNQSYTTAEVLNMPFIEMNLEQNPNANNFAKCGDPNLGTLLVKNLIHKNIRCGGKPIDINFMEDLFPMRDPKMVDTKRWYNRYTCDPDMNIYFAANAVGASVGASFWATVLKSNHGSNGKLSLPAIGLDIVDKENQIQYAITDLDTSTDWGHRIQLTPRENIVGSVKWNTPYLVLPARLVGGCNCPIITNAMPSLGYTQEVHPIRLRRDWKLCIDALTGNTDKFQFAIIYDKEGNPQDGWDIFEAQEMREGIRAALNIIAFLGTPTTNQALITGLGATIDAAHTGFYGFLPTLKYGGGNVYKLPSDKGFDMEADGEPIMLYQDSRKKVKKFLVLHGAKFMLSLIDRTNKMVSRTIVGADMWEAYRRLGSLTGENFETEIVKLGISGYKYQGFSLDFKKMDSWSDYRFVGGDKFNSMAIFLAQEGITENGKAVPAVEFYTYGNGKWTGNYEEHYIDYRKINGCNDIGGWAAQSIAMATHCPGNHILIDPVKAN